MVEGTDNREPVAAIEVAGLTVEARGRARPEWSRHRREPDEGHRCRVTRSRHSCPAGIPVAASAKREWQQNEAINMLDVPEVRGYRRAVIEGAVIVPHEVRDQAAPVATPSRLGRITDTPSTPATARPHTNG